MLVSANKFKDRLNNIRTKPRPTTSLSLVPKSKPFVPKQTPSPADTTKTRTNSRVVFLDGSYGEWNYGEWE